MLTPQRNPEAAIRSHIRLRRERPLDTTIRSYHRDRSLGIASNAAAIEAVRKTVGELIGHFCLDASRAIALAVQDLNSDIVTYEIKVPAEDRGRIIGKSGMTIRSLSQVVRSLGYKYGFRSELRLMEEVE